MAHHWAEIGRALRHSFALVAGGVISRDRPSAGAAQLPSWQSQAATIACAFLSAMRALDGAKRTKLRAVDTDGLPVDALRSMLMGDVGKV